MSEFVGQAWPGIVFAYLILFLVTLWLCWTSSDSQGSFFNEAGMPTVWVAALVWPVTLVVYLATGVVGAITTAIDRNF